MKRQEPRARRRRKPEQRTLASRGRGGWRAGAGRKRIPEHRRTTVAHRRRPSLPRQAVLHVTLLIVEGVPRLRRPRTVRAIRGCIAAAHKEGFRVVEFAVLSNHLHLIVEADDRRALGRGMQGLKIRLAKRLNRVFGRSGALFDERYHARQIRTPRQARAALGYVLNNYRRHQAQRGRSLPKRWVDPFSSAPFFGGWTGRTVTADEHVGDDVTLAARRWVLTTGWKRRGLLEPGAVPGPAP